MPIWTPRLSVGRVVGRQLMVEDQIMQQNTWLDPQDKYRPVRPESYGPILPKYRVGPTLADAYAYPPTVGGPVYYGGTPFAPAAPGGAAVPRTGGDGSGRDAAAVPVFQPWPQVPNDIWGAPYYGYVRQPIGHVKIWTGRLSYIYKPIYASPPVESPQPASAMAARAPQAVAPNPRLRVRWAWGTRDCCPGAGRIAQCAAAAKAGGSASRPFGFRAGGETRVGSPETAPAADWAGALRGYPESWETKCGARCSPKEERLLSGRFLTKKNLDYPSTAAEMMIELTFEVHS